MPQPSASRQPVNFSNAFCTSTGSGAPPESQDFSECKSAVLAAGWLSNGDEHGRHAGEHRDFLRLDVAHRRLGVEARVQHQFGAQADAEQHVHRQRIDVERRQHRQASRSSPAKTAAAGPRVVSMYCAGGGVRLACVSIAPFGRPVVPPVYCSTAIASSGSATG